MTTTKFMSMLRAAIFTGAVGLIPTVVMAADDGDRSSDPATEYVPDHAQAEEHGGVANGTSADLQGAPKGIPTHEEAEARGAGDSVSTNNQGMHKDVPDHATEAEARSLGETAQ